MLMLSITLHNIPEGLAVGVAFGALRNGLYSKEALLGAVSVAVGSGVAVSVAVGSGVAVSVGINTSVFKVPHHK